MTSSVSIQDDAKPWTKDALSEDGCKRRHTHDPNDCTLTYTCSLGHKWSRRVCHPCWCGWSKYQAENTASIRVFLEIWCWMGEDNFIMVNGKAHKGAMDVRLETNTMPELDEILLENEAGFCQLLRGILN